MSIRSVFALVNAKRYSAGIGPLGGLPLYWVTPTHINGEVAVRVHDPLPTFISVNADLWYSGSLVPVDEVLKTGVVLDYSAKRASQGYWLDSQGRPGIKSGPPGSTWHD